MTKTEWDGMGEGEKDALVAETVMKWTLCSVSDPSGVVNCGDPFDNWVDADGGGMYEPRDFLPTTDRNACALVLDEIERRGDNVIFRFLNIFRMWCDITVAGADHRQAAWFGMRADADLLCRCAVKVVEDG